MKKILLAIPAILLLAFSIGHAQKMENVEGSGNLVKQNRTVGNFSGVAVSGDMNVRIASSTQTTSVAVEAEENLQSYIETEIKDDNLRISYKKGFNVKAHKPVTIY